MMLNSQSILRAGLALLACVTPLGAAHAGGLQVTPVSVTISERSGVVWLNNGSATPLRAQVRVFRWHQDGGEDELVETQDLVASPPFAQIDANGQQVIRLVRFGEAAIDMTACEQSYRIIVDELPDLARAQDKGLSFVLRYSVPIYLTNPACRDAKPDLSWQIVTQGDKTWLNVANSGQARAQLASVSFIDSSGRRAAINDGLLGYVLAGAERRFALANPASTFPQAGQIEVLINGLQVRQPVTLAAQGM